MNFENSKILKLWRRVVLISYKDCDDTYDNYLLNGRVLAATVLSLLNC